MNGVRRGVDWGEPSPVPDDAVWVADDAAATTVVTEARRAGEPPPRLCLTGGDLARTLGGRADADRLRNHDATHVSVDLGAALLDGRLHWFIAHLVARRSWWWGPITVVANAAYIGRWNVAPRAHPGDGRLDLLVADPPVGDRLRARRRLPLGTHVPHPDIIERRITAHQVDFDRPVDVHLDGTRHRGVRALSVRVEPAALDVWI